MTSILAQRWSWRATGAKAPEAHERTLGDRVMPVVIRRFRVSIAQTATVLDLLRHEPGASRARLRQLSRATGYQQLFRRVGTKGTVDEELGVSAPWHVPPEEQAFWSYYLKAESVLDVKEDRAWNSAVPLRMPLAVHLLDGYLPSALGGAASTARDTVVAYFYPHGLGLVVDIDVAGAFELDDFVAAARRLRGVDLLDDGWPPLPTDAFMRGRLLELVDQLSVTAFDVDSLGPRCTVVTVIVGETDGDDSAHQGTIRAALQGLAGWREHWKHFTVTDEAWSETCVPMEGEPSNNVVVGVGRGRAVWYPLDFVAPATGQTPKTKLRSLHTELTLGGLQVESLAQLAYRSLHEPEWTSLQDNRVRTAVSMLRALFHRARDLPSHSPRRHILDNGYAPALNQVEQRLGRYPTSFNVP